jgi:hypothetical protein
MKKFTIGTLVLLMLVGCAPASQVDAPDPHRFGELVPGVSTMADATQKLGPPNSYDDVGQGRTLLQWIDVYSPRPIHLAILFNANNGHMIKVQSVFVQ